MNTLERKRKMIKKILAALLWFASMFCELFIITLIKMQPQGVVTLCLLPLAFNLLTLFGANKLWTSSLEYDQKKVTLEEKRKRVILENMPLYIGIVCFLPTGIYTLIKRKDLDKRQRISLFISMLFTAVWLVLVYATMELA